MHCRIILPFVFAGLVAVVSVSEGAFPQAADEPLALPNSADASCTSAGHRLLFHLDQPPIDSQLTFPRLNNVVQFAFWQPAETVPSADESPMDEAGPYGPPSVVATDHRLALTQTPSQWRIQLSDEITYPAIIGLQLVSPPIYAPDGYRCVASADGQIALPARHAMVSGEKLQFEPLPHKNTVGYWVNPNDSATWRFSTDQAQTWQVHVLQGCGAGQGGSRIQFDFGTAQLEYDVEETGHFQNFRWKHAGSVELPAGNEQQLQVSCVNLARNAVMDIRQIRLVPSDRQPGLERRLTETASDCDLPPITVGQPPRAGQRTLIQASDSSDSTAYHTLYLPTDWQPGKSYPVLVEWGGNGPYSNDMGDTNSGRVEDGVFGYGLAGSDGFIWLCLPFLNNDGTKNVTRWWGDPPDFSPDATLEYAHRAIDDVCQQWGGDSNRLVLVGFSRGSLACNYLGLHNDRIAVRWTAMICYSHYDGLRPWPYPMSDPISAQGRLKRLAGRPQLIISESNQIALTNLQRTQQLLSDSEDGMFTFLETGFINHDDDWTLRPVPARNEARRWLHKILDLAPREESL